MKAPDQYQTELLLFNVLGHGDKSKLAAELNVSLSDISQQVNPNEPLKSYFFQCKRFLYALKGINPQAHQILLADLNAIGSLDGSEQLNLSDLTGEVAQETAEFVCARLKNKPVHVQRKEALDIKAAVSRVIAGLDNEAQRKGAQVATGERRQELKRKTG